MIRLGNSPGDLKDGEDKICRAYCNYYKPNRTENERCRGFTVGSLLLSLGALPETANIKVGPFDSSYKHDFLRQILCEHCPFFVDGCDFTAADAPPGVMPCGGLIFISSLLKQAIINENTIQLIDDLDRKAYSSVSLSPECALKRLEEYYVYHIFHDDLYEVNQEAFQFLEKCEAGFPSDVWVPDLNPDFVKYCMEEGLLVHRPGLENKKVWPEQAPSPSLRYLEWLITRDCNLRCWHCYLGESEDSEFPVGLIQPLLEQFSAMQGLRVLVSGGEPTLYRHFEFLNEIIDQYPLRFVLLTNGLTMTNAFAKALKFHEVQISLDGMMQGHETIRGSGTFSRVLRAMECVKDAGLELSVATMVHRANLSEWDDMGRLIERFGVKEWNIDYPCVCGRWELHPDLFVDENTGSECMKYGFGGSYHGSDHGWTCGRHLAAVLPSGDVCRCALYSNLVLGNVKTGLRKAWERVQHIPIADTACCDCTHADQCGGGCRYRAGDPYAKDSVMCALFSSHSS